MQARHRVVRLTRGNPSPPRIPRRPAPCPCSTCRERGPSTSRSPCTRPAAYRNRSSYRLHCHRGQGSATYQAQSHPGSFHRGTVPLRVALHGDICSFRVQLLSPAARDADDDNAPGAHVTHQLIERCGAISQRSSWTGWRFTNYHIVCRALHCSSCKRGIAAGGRVCARKRCSTRRGAPPRRQQQA